MNWFSHIGNNPRDFQDMTKEGYHADLRIIKKHPNLYRGIHYKQNNAWYAEGDARDILHKFNYVSWYKSLRLK